MFMQKIMYLAIFIFITNFVDASNHKKTQLLLTQFSQNHCLIQQLVMKDDVLRTELALPNAINNIQVCVWDMVLFAMQEQKEKVRQENKQRLMRKQQEQFYAFLNSMNLWFADK